MRYLSVCSGIEAASVAWKPLGWEAVAFSEIEKFPSAVLAHHYPNVPNWGDMTKFKDWPDATVDLLVGGTPCQSFSVAGLRKGMADPRGNLALTFLAIADRYRPEWLVWENVPGVLSSNGGRDFGSILGGMVELGYGVCYRVLDAQYFGVAQRRRRVFVVGHAGDWHRAAAVLLEPEGLRGDSAPRREAGKGLAPKIAARTKGGGGLGTDFDCDGGLIRVVAGCLNSAGGHAVPGNSIQDVDQGYLQVVATPPHIAHCLNAGGMGRQDYETETLIPTIGGGFDVAHSLRADGFDASEDGTGRGTPLVPVGVDFQNCADTGDVTHPLGAKDNGLGLGLGLGPSMQVRRLTPRECERLQGFPDDYTLIPHGRSRKFMKGIEGAWGGDKKLAADGPRYKALGNSMAVPVMRWIGERIQAVEQLQPEYVPHP